MSAEGRGRPSLFVKWLKLAAVMLLAWNSASFLWTCLMSVLLFYVFRCGAATAIRSFIAHCPPICLLLAIRSQDIACRGHAAPGSSTRLLSATTLSVWGASNDADLDLEFMWSQLPTATISLTSPLHLLFFFFFCHKTTLKDLQRSQRRLLHTLTHTSQDSTHQWE